MKGIILFDNMNDLAFMDADDELVKHIQRLAFKDGLLEDLSFQNKEGSINKNVVMQLFSPLIASYKVMKMQFGNKYKYLEAEDGILIVFSEILNFIAINICDKEENLSEAQKELAVFNICAEMLYGPSLLMIKENIPTCCDKVSRSNLLQTMLKTWRVMKMEQQIFLVEAIERLIVNQEITALSINLLQEILEKTRHAFNDAVFSHAFLIVDTKLLALYSSRNSGQLPKEILLLLILTVQALKVVHSPEEVALPDKDGDDEFFIPISASMFKESGEQKNSLHSKNVLPKSSKIELGAQTLLMYLKSRNGVLVPHILYILEVASGIKLVILSELAQYAAVSSHLSSLIKSFHQLQCHPSHRQPNSSFESLETKFRSLIESILKSKMYSDKEKSIKKIVSKWDQLKHCDVDFLFKSLNDKVSSPKLESNVSSVCEALKNLFEEIVAFPCLAYEDKTHSIEHQDVLIQLQKLSIKRLVDVGDFLEVKAMQNVTMASYISEYPGLIHFIYVDRSCDCLIAPTVAPRKGHMQGIATLRKKIWNMVSYGRSHLDGANKFCCLWKDDDLYFFYNIWFENSRGQAIKPSVFPSMKKFPEKGILCGNFFKKVTEECFPDAALDHIYCYEMFCVHLDSTSVETIVDHSRRLSSQLWDFTGAYRTSLDLL